MFAITASTWSTESSTLSAAVPAALATSASARRYYASPGVVLV